MPAMYMIRHLIRTRSTLVGMEPSWLDDDQQRLWRAFLRVHSRLISHLGRELQTSSDLSLADYDVLVRATESSDAMIRPAELAEMLQWEQSRLSHQLTRMQSRGLIRKCVHPNDGRGTVIEATERGVAAIRSAAPGHSAAVLGLFLDPIQQDEGEVMTAVLERILSLLDTVSGGDDAAIGS